MAFTDLSSDSTRFQLALDSVEDDSLRQPLIHAKFAFNDIEKRSNYPELRAIARQKLIEAITSPTTPEAIERATHFANFVVFLRDDMHSSGHSPETDRFAQMARDPEWEETLVQLGRASSENYRFIFSGTLEDSLQLSFREMQVLPPHKQRALLEDIASEFIQRSKSKDDGTSVWTAIMDARRVIRRHLEAHHAPMRIQLRKTLSEELQIPLAKIPQPIADLVYERDHTDVRQALKQMVELDYFAKLGPIEQGNIFHVVSLTLDRAHRSQDPRHARLLRNSVAPITRGSVIMRFGTVLKDSSGESLGGEIRMDHEHACGFGGCTPDRTIEVFAHEMSHEASKFRGDQESVGYFEEEMRAWYVGQYAAKGRLPTKKEALARARRLLFFEGKETDPYGRIRKAFLKDPKSFSKHLEQLGFPKVEGPITLEGFQHSVDEIAAAKLQEEAPQWGWAGFLENHYGPTDNDYAYGTAVGPPPRVTNYIELKPSLEQKGIPEEMLDRMFHSISYASKFEGENSLRGRIIDYANGHLLRAAHSDETWDSYLALQRHRTFSSAVKGIAVDFAGLWGSKTNPEAAQFYFDLAQDPRFFDTFINLGSVDGAGRFLVRPFNAFAETLAKLRPHLEGKSVKWQIEVLNKFAERFGALARVAGEKDETWTEAMTLDLLR